MNLRYHRRVAKHPPKKLRVKTSDGLERYLIKKHDGWTTEKPLKGRITHVWHAHEWMHLPVSIPLEPGQVWIMRF